MSTRDLDVDVLRVLERLPSVTEVLAWDKAEADAVRFCVVLRPYTMRHLVEAHYSLLSATGYDVAGRVLYVDADAHQPPMMGRMHALRASPVERERARARVEERMRDAKWTQRLEEAALARTQMEEGLRRVGGGKLSAVVASMQSGVFEVVPDPFPSPKAARYRVLLADPDPTTAAALRRISNVDTTSVEGGWAVVEALTDAGDAPYDLALCPVVMEGPSGAKLYRMVLASRPEAAARIVFVADRAAVDAAPPSTARARVLARPVDEGEVKALLEQWRTPRG